MQGGLVKYYQLGALFLAIFITACSTNLNTTEWGKKLSSTEYSLRQDCLLIDINCSIFEKNYGIQTETNYKSHGIWTRAGCNPKIVSRIEAGSKIMITDISMRTDASGRCWSVLAKESNERQFFIPSCKFFHTKLWVTPKQPTESNNLKFSFNKAYLTAD